MLLHRAKVKANRQLQPGVTEGGKVPTEIICLVPELCFMTGLTEDMRTDMNIKKELGTHIRLSPSARYEQLQILLDQIRNTPEAIRWVERWGLQLGDELNVMGGRVVPSEKIIFGRREVETDFRCDWTRSCATEEVISGVEIKNWLCVYPQSRENVVARFAELACEVGKRMGIKIGVPMTAGLKDDRPDTYYNEIKKRLSGQVRRFFYTSCFLDY